MCDTRRASGKASWHACAALTAATFHDVRLCCLTAITRCVPTSMAMLYIRCARTLQPICHRRIPIILAFTRKTTYLPLCGRTHRLLIVHLGSVNLVTDPS